MADQQTPPRASSGGGGSSEGGADAGRQGDHPVLSPEQISSPPNQQQQQQHGQLARRPSTPNAYTTEITTARGPDTQGIVNQHPNPDSLTPAANAREASAALDAQGFRIGVSEDRNKKCRRTMEDSHAFVYDFGGVKGQGYFAVFDGHAGKHAAEWCGQNFHKYLLEQLSAAGDPSTPIPDLLNQTFHVVDSELSKLAAAGGTHSGCTAVTAFLRLEDEQGRAVQLDPQAGSDGARPTGSEVARGGAAANQPAPGEDEGAQRPPLDESDAHEDGDEPRRRFGDGVHRERIRSLFGGSSSSSSSPSSSARDSSGADAPSSTTQSASSAAEHKGKPALPKNMAKRTLYTANVGDARAVLSRGGKAVRLTYDHKGSDAQEAKRITDAGGFVMNNRVNGVLAVTRSLGDSSMKEFVVGSPYTTETTLGDDDEFLIIACDGLWDVCEDQMAVDLIRDVKDPQKASGVLLDHALTNFSTDNLSVLVVALQPGNLS